MLLLVTGASGVGKTTARLHAQALLDDVETVELADLASVPTVPTVAWRQEVTEVAVRRALDLAPTGRHLLLSGDPVAAGEVLAAPSADALDVAVCLLDADEATQTQRLRGRGDPPELLGNHLAYAAWMRAHAVDPGHVPEVLTTDAWPPMRWDRWVGRAPGAPWAMTVVDTSERTPADVGAAVAAWCRDALSGHAPVFRAGWFRDRQDRTRDATTGPVAYSWP